MMEEVYEIKDLKKKVILEAHEGDTHIGDEWRVRTCDTLEEIEEWLGKQNYNRTWVILDFSEIKETKFDRKKWLDGEAKSLLYHMKGQKILSKGEVPFKEKILAYQRGEIDDFFEEDGGKGSLDGLNLPEELKECLREHGIHSIEYLTNKKIDWVSKKERKVIGYALFEVRSSN